MNWYKFFHLAGQNKKKTPIKKAAPRLRLEELEVRDVPAAPFVNSVTPTTGGILGAAPLNSPERIEVVFSENVTGADNKNNFKLFASDGTAVTIGAVSYNATTFTTTINGGANLTVSGGQLTAGTYSLFLRGDQIVDVDENLPLARPGELVVANAGRNSISTVSLNGTTLGAVSLIGLPAEGANPYTPSASAHADVNADGRTDLIVASASQVTVSVHLGNGTEFSTTPDLVLTTAGSGAPLGLLVADFSGDGRNEIVVRTSGANGVLVFTNQNATPGQLAFDAGKSYGVGLSPNGIVSGKFDTDNNLDIAVSNGAVNASNNYTVNVITGKGDGTFNATTEIIVGNNTPSGLVSPTGIAAGAFDTGLTDIAVHGGNGIAVLTNTSVPAVPPSFTTTVVSATVPTSIAVGAVRTNANARPDIVYTTGTNLGVLVNDGNGVFAETGNINSGVNVPAALQLIRLTASASLNPVYVNQQSAGGFIARSPLQTGRITNIPGTTGTTPISVTSANHGLQDGQQVAIIGVTGTTTANGTFYVDVTGTNSFDLIGSSVDLDYTGGGTWIALPGIVTNVTKPTGTSPLTITAPNHGLRTGQQVTLTAIGGSTNANGSFFITRVDANTFTLNGTGGTTLPGGYTNFTGTYALPVYVTGDTPTNVTLGDFTGDGIRDAVVPGSLDNTLAFFTGSGSAGTGDGTFLTATNLPLLTNGRPVATAVGDLNNDSIPDLVATDTKNNAINIFLGLADGGYRAPTTKSLTSSGNARNPVSVAIGDIDNNGKLDVVVASAQDGNVAIFPGNGDGTLGAYTRPITNISTPTQVALADVNVDGVLDVLVAHNGKSRGTVVRIGNGNMTFQTSGSGEVFSKGTPRATAIAVGDFNRDGNPDFVVTDDNPNGPGTVRVALGAGNGTFPSGNITTLTVGANPTSVIVADFNADGYADIATASRSNTTTENITVLLNDVGTGFQPAFHTQLTTDPNVGGSVLHRLQAVNINSDAFIDLVVSSSMVDLPPADGIPDTGTPNPANNTHMLLGVGDGSFTSNVDNYLVAGAGVAVPFPSAVNVVSDPFRLLSTFNVGGTTVSVNLLRNGNFETRALTSEQGNLDGWTTFRLSDTTRGSAGQILAQSGASSPLSLATVPPANGRYRAMLDQQNLQPFSGNNNPNNDDSYSGSHALYQDVTIPANATSVRLSFSLYLNSADIFTDIGASGSVLSSDPQLDYRTPDANQQVRVDIMTPSGAVLDTDTRVRQNLFKAQTNTTTNGTLNFTGGTAFDLSAYAGQTIRIRFAATNNQGKLIVGIDDVRVQTVFTDNAAPTVDRLNLRNPTFLASANTTPQATDPTIVGKIADNGSINNVTQLTFDLSNNGFGGTDDVSITTFDANGFFTYTPTTLLPGFQTIPVRVYDQAGNFSSQTLNFILQGPSLTNWSSAGPGPIDVSGAGLNYNNVSGKITGIAVDPRDASGNTFYISSPNGGVWKTTDGGKDWLALTDNVMDATGQRINVSAGSLVFDTVNNAIYAATGVDDNAFTSRSSIGVLRSTDDGQTWSVLGGATGNASGTIIPGVFSGARVSKIAVSKPVPPSTGNPAGIPSAVYVAITSWDDPLKAPMILKSSNPQAAIPTWTNVLNPQNMFVANRSDTLQGSGGSLASVTDLIVDPFNPQRVIIGLGNIGQGVLSGSGAGVWKTIDGGNTWDRIEGGDNLSLALARYDGTLPFGSSVGRITLAQGNGRVGDEKFVYVLISNPPVGQNQFAQGDYMGLYKSKDNMLNFTKVMLKQPATLPLPGHARFTENYDDIGLLGNEGGNVGAMVVDPSNPNVVYVGGSRRFAEAAVAPQHAFIRVDTGNMRDTDFVDLIDGLTNDGDDRDKAGAAAAAGGTYPTGTDASGAAIGGVAYDGEGVYWYDIEQAKASDSSNLRRLPPSIHRLLYDTQGRLLIGTENGLFRGVPLGFGYDFRSSYAGILAGGGGGGGGGAFNPPGMTITDLNGNLQITDLTSVAIDPTDRNQLYTSASGVGTALTSAGVSAWQSTGLTGPTLATGNNINVPNAFQILTANLAPDAPADAITTLYRTWQYRQLGTENSLIPELSTNGGGTFSSTSAAGISSQDTTDLAPVLAINTVKASVTQPDGTVQFYDELLFGTDNVYLTRTGGAVWDAISGRLGAGFISAVAFSQNPGEYLAGTNEAKVFLKTATGNFTEITGNLGTLIGVTLTIRINGITVDPNSANTVYVMAGTDNGRPSVFRGTVTRNATTGAVTGATWVAVTGGLPQVASYKMIIDRRASTGAPNGRFYVGTDRGVFTSTDGTSWTELGKGLPAAPVVDLQFNPNLEILAAATQGRGVFTLSTARSGPAIVNVTPASPTDDGPLTQVNVTFNSPVDPRTFNADSNNAPRTLLTLLALNSTDFATTRIRELVQLYHGRVANAGDIQTGLGYFFRLNPNGSISQQFDSKYGVFVNTSLNQGELNYVSFLTSNSFYFDTLGGGTNATWIEKVWQDFLRRTATGDTVATGFLNQLNAGTVSRLTITQKLTGTISDTGTVPGPTALINPLNVRAREFHTNLVASLFNKLVARNYPLSGASSTEITGHVDVLARGGLLRNVIARIISTTEAYQKMGNDYALPAGVTARAVTLGNLTGTVGGATNAPVLDLIVTGSDDRLRVFKGKVGGGYNLNPDLILNLQAGSNATDVAVADIDGDGMLDLAVANSGLTSNSVSVFFNNRTAIGNLGFEPIENLDGGNNPIGIAVGNANNDTGGILDIVTANRTVNGANNYTASILVGLGSRTFSGPTQIKVGDNTPSTSELVGPTDLAFADITVDGKPDLIVSGDNGVVVLLNTTSTTTAGGAPTFGAAPPRLTNVATTSVAVANLDSDTDRDIVTTSAAAAGEVHVFRNDGAGTFVESRFASGSNPSQVQLADMNGDGKNDVVVVNEGVGGGLSVLNNNTVAATSGPDSLVFASPMVYPLTGSRPAFLASGDTNQDGLIDLAIGYRNTEFVSTVVGQQQGFLRVATDPNWLDWVFRSLAGRPYNQAEFLLFAPILGDSGLAYLNGPFGIAAPLSITPTDSTNLTYTLTFAPRVFDGSYRLFIGPNSVPGLLIKDFIDQNGSYLNTGNPMNQDRDAANGETPVGPFPSDVNQGDRFTTRVAVNNNDNGRFVTSLYTDFQGTTATNGREPDQAGFIAQVNPIEAARLASLTTVATTLVGSTEEVDGLITETYNRYLRRVPGADLAAARTAIQNGTQSVRGLVVQLLASDEYFTNFGGGTNAGWMTQIYADVLPGTPAPAFPSGQTRAQIANALVFSDAAIQQTVTEYMLKFLGRAPVRNSADSRLDETTGFPFLGNVTTNFTTLLRAAPASGQLTGDQKVIITLVSSNEYLRVRGNSNFEWLKSLYTRVLGRSTIDTAGPEFTGVLDTLLTNYSAARETALTTIISSREFRNRFYTDYYTQFLSRAPTLTELNAQESFYLANGQRLEAVVANLMQTNEFDPLSGPNSSNTRWIGKVYSLLLNRDTSGDAVADAQLTRLNNATLAQLAGVRYTIAREVLNATSPPPSMTVPTYRELLITNFYVRYLGRNPTAGELTNFVGQMNTGATQQTVLIRSLRHAEYFLYSQS